MTSPIDPARRSPQPRKSARAKSNAAKTSGDKAAGASNLPVPVPGTQRSAPQPAVPLAGAFAAQLLGQDTEKRGLRAGPSLMDTAKGAYNRTKWSGSKDRRARKGRTAKAEI